MNCYSLHVGLLRVCQIIDRMPIRNVGACLCKNSNCSKVTINSQSSMCSASSDCSIRFRAVLNFIIILLNVDIITSAEILLLLSTKILQEEMFPESWEIIVIIKMSKRDDFSK